ncbi:MAG: hypothetical protein AABX38_02430 [Candidatus Micrarchaeota archaeon]
MNANLSRSNLYQTAKSVLRTAAVAFALHSAGCGGQEETVQKFRAGVSGTCTYDSSTVKLVSTTQTAYTLKTSGDETQFIVFNMPDLLPSLNASVYISGADVDLSKNTATAYAVIANNSCKSYEKSSSWDLYLNKVAQTSGDINVSDGSVAVLCHNKFKACMEAAFSGLKFNLSSNGSWNMSSDVSLREVPSQ